MSSSSAKGIWGQIFKLILFLYIFWENILLSIPGPLLSATKERIRACGTFGFPLGSGLGRGRREEEEGSGGPLHLVLEEEVEAEEGGSAERKGLRSPCSGC